MHDVQDGDPDIHWPSGFAPGLAHGFCHAHTVVRAPASRVFARLIDVERWPLWVPGVERVRFGAPQNTFELWLGDDRFEVIVGEQVPHTRLGWSGIGARTLLYQAWLLRPRGDGATHVVSESVVRGPAGPGPGRADRLNALWLARLRRTLEADPPPDAAAPGDSAPHEPFPL
ncbi:SRPBCC family protein [Streptomyces sp. NPDC047046]|uniref:SRPBCC family protein n=1 Tax=Streptomyces sp. NPDC047046 TaxID=3155378 RepID=UPI0033D7B7D6